MRTPLTEPSANQPQDQLMRRLENVFSLHVQRARSLTSKKRAVVDLIRSHPPVRQAVALVLEQFLEKVETARIARLTVEFDQRLLQLPPRRSLARHSVGAAGT